MLHIHKELFVEHNGKAQWEHLETVYLKLYEAETIKKFVNKCFIGCGDDVSGITAKDIGFVLPDEIYTVCNIPDAQRVWDKMMPTPFNYHFGCWPWDFADSLADPVLVQSLRDEGILDFRMVVLL